jgi:hypothetical protein
MCSPGEANLTAEQNSVILTALNILDYIAAELDTSQIARLLAASIPQTSPRR